MEKYVVIERLWLTRENRHAEAGETVELPAEVGAILQGTGAVLAAADYHPVSEFDLVAATAQQPVWSGVEERAVGSGEVFLVRAEDAAHLVSNGVVSVAAPEAVEAVESKPSRRRKEGE